MTTTTTSESAPPPVARADRDGPHDGWATAAPDAARSARRAAALAAATAGAVALLLATRRDWGLGPMDWRAFGRVGFDVYSFGWTLQSLLLPIAVLYLLSGTDLVRRVMLGAAGRRDRRRFLGLLVLVQVGTIAVYLQTQNEFALLFPIVVGALFGGLSVALPLGVATYAALWLSQMARYAAEDGIPWPSWWAEALSALYEPTFVPALWAGLAAGVAADALGARRGRPPVAFALGGGVVLASGVLVALYQGDPTWLLEEVLLPSALVVAFAAAAFALVARDARAAADRRLAEAAELERARAELRALRAQINPHFLFNALNTIRYFAREAPLEARRLLGDLSVVFQRALRAGDRVPLADELRHVEAYLALERARLGERLHATVDAPAASLDVPVPTLVLQPLVENAVVHGIAPRGAGGAVKVTIARGEDGLCCEVADDGVGIPPARRERLLDPAVGAGDSIGLRNVDARLRAMYGDAAGLVISGGPDGGTRVAFTLPVDPPAAPSDGTA